MKVSGTLLPILIFSGFCASECEATVYYSDGTVPSVQSIHNNQAHNGDTIAIPSGTFMWTTRLNITKAIILQGAGVGVTIIKDGVQSGSLIQVSLVAGQVSGITNIEFQNGGRTNYNNVPGIIHIDGSNTNGAQFRFDHNKWYLMNGSIVPNTVLGVADHNAFTTNGRGTFTIYSSHWNDIPNGYDASWSAPIDFGSSKFFFIEDNTFTNTDTTYMGWVSDAYAGARFVVRHNTMLGMAIGDHGTESVGRERGSRAFEVYNNTMDGNNVNAFIGGSRSSTVLIHDNNVTNYWSPAYFTLSAYRNHFRFDVWGGGDGTNAWDVNSPTIFFTGSAASNTPGTTVTVSGSPNWTPNQWVGYTVRRLTDNCGSGTIDFGAITASTSNTLTYAGADFASNLSFCAGDSLEIRKVLQLLDQPGRGQGSLMANLLHPPLPPGWNNQVTEPCYMWNNGPEQVRFSSGAGTIRAGEHFFHDTPMPGYTPYTYPHPLVTGTGTPTPTPIGSPTPTPSATSTPFPSATSTATGAPTATPTPTATPAPSATTSPTPGPTPTPSPSSTPTPVPHGNPPTDFNGDGHPDYLLYNAGTRQTAIMYLNNNVVIGAALGPTLAAGWGLRGVADFNLDDHPDYLLYNTDTRQTAMWYLNNNVFIGGVYAPTLPTGWELVATGNFNNNRKPDYVLYKASTLQTAVWYLNNNVLIGGDAGPTLPNGWILIGVGDFDRDGHTDYALFYPSSGYTAILYLSGPTLIGAAWGPTVPSGWVLLATADFDGDGNLDYLLYKASTLQTAIWYLNNNVYVGGAYGPTLPAGWILAAP